jgi:autotransporter-associated beta strand protein
MRRIAKIIGLLLSMGFAFAAHAEVIASYDFNGGSFSDVANATGVDAQDVYFGPGATLVAGVDVAQAAEGQGISDGTGDDMAGAYAAGDYYTFTVTADDGYTLNLDTLSFDIWRALRGCQDFAIYCSVDNFASQIVFENDYITQTWQPYTLDFSTVTNGFDTLTNVTFHIVIDDRANDSTYSSATAIDNLSLTGTIASESETPTLSVAPVSVSLDLLASDMSTNGIVMASYMVGISSSNDIQIVSISTVETNGFSAAVVDDTLGVNDTTETITVTFDNTSGALVNDGDTTNNTLVVSWTEAGSTNNVINTLEVAVDVTYIKVASTFALDQDSLSLALVAPDTTANGIITASFTPGTLSTDVDILSVVAGNGFSASVANTLGVSNPSEEVSITYNSGSLTNRGDTAESDLEVTWAESGSSVSNTATATLSALYLIPEASSWTGDDVTNPTYWELGVSTNWTSSDMFFYTGDTVTFGNTGAGAVSVRTQVQPASVTFANTNSFDYTFDDVTANVESISAETGGINVLSNGNVTLNVKITGDTDITHSGAGTLKIGAGVNNDFVGDVVVDGGGTLKVGSNNFLGNTNNTITVSNGSTLDLSGVNNFQAYGENSFVFEDGTFLTNSTTTVLNAAFSDQLQFGGDVTIGGQQRIDIFGNIDVTGEDITITYDYSNPDTGSVIGGDNREESIALWLIKNGTLFVNNAVCLGDNADVRVQSNATMRGNGDTASGDWTTANDVFMEAGSYITKRDQDTEFNLSGTVTLEGDIEINPGGLNDSIKLSGDLIGSNNVTFNNQGNLRVGTSFNDSGFTGDLIIGDNSGNKTLQLASVDEGAEAATVTADIVINETDSESFDIAVVDSNDTLTVSGVISGSGAAGVTKVSAGSLILNGNNTYTGPTLFWNGVVQVNGDSSAASNTVTVLGAATLAGTGTVGGAVIVNGTVAPGINVGTLTCSDDVTIDAGTFSVEPGDLLVVGGDLTLTNATLSMDGTLSGDIDITIATVAGTIIGTFDGLDEGAEVQSGYSISYLDGAVKIAGSSSADPTVSASISGSSLSLSWDGGGSYNVLTNADLTNSEGWGVATNGTSPIDLEIGSDSELFYKLESE